MPENNFSSFTKCRYFGLTSNPEVLSGRSACLARLGGPYLDRYCTRWVVCVIWKPQCANQDTVRWLDMSDVWSVSGEFNALSIPVEWVVLRLCIQEVPGSNLGTGYLGWGFYDFIGPSGQMSRIYLKLSYDRLLPHPFNSLFMKHSTVQCRLNRGIENRRP
jgi:hypothetical protein